MEITNILGTIPNVVSVTLSEIKKKRKTADAKVQPPLDITDAAQVSDTDLSPESAKP